MKLNISKDSAFFERYGFFKSYGDGLMLVYWSGTKLEYVMFTPHYSNVKKIINKELLEKYKKEILGV